MGLSADIQEKNNYYINYIEEITNRHCRKDAVSIFEDYITNKQNLYLTFGGQMKFSEHVSIESEASTVYQKLHQVYDIVQDFYYSRYNPIPENKSFFMFAYMEYVYKNFGCAQVNTVRPNSIQGEADKLLETMRVLSAYKTMYEQKLPLSFSIKLKRKDKELKFSEGMRPLRAIRKLLEYIDFPVMGAFRRWRSEISTVLTSKNIEGDLVISIDPIDFLTLSNNNCNWSSCMKLPTGSYSKAIPAMMNSPYSVVAYLQSDDKPFMVNDIEYPNKTWRALFFIDPNKKEWVCNSQDYPFHSEALLRKSYELISKHINKTLGIQFCEPIENHAFYDFSSISSEFYDDDYAEDEFFEMIEDGSYEEIDFLLERTESHSVVISMAPYYNDIYQHCETTHNEYLVMWNAAVDSRQPRFADVCGATTCLLCGTEYDVHHYTISDDDEENEVKICGKCAEYNRQFDFIMVPFISTAEDVIITHNYIVNYLSDIGKEPTIENIKAIVDENLYSKNGSFIERGIHERMRLRRFNDATFSDVSFIRCKDKELPEFTGFTRMPQYDTQVRVGYCDSNGEIIEVEDVNHLDFVYFYAKINANSEKYRPYMDYRHFHGHWNSVEVTIDGETFETYIELKVPESFKNLKNMVEVVDDKREKYQILCSI